MLSKISIRKISALFVLASLALAPLAGNAQWKMAGNKIKTEWADKVKPDSPLPEYPRPQMLRSNWQNLNGLWNYAITKKGDKKPVFGDEKILVPFAVESSLSGVMKTVGENSELWYERTFEIPQSWNGGKILLHFGAVDWRADVWVNDIYLGNHQGGFAPFSFDITDTLKSGSKNTLTVKVFDPTNKSANPVGKQSANPEGIFYTPVTGIWQTVWLEPVPKNHIENVTTIPDLDAMCFNVTVKSKSAGKVKATLLDGEKKICTATGSTNTPIRLDAPRDIKCWTPDTPKLYNMLVETFNADGKPLDSVLTYTAMRKISMKRSPDRWIRMELNNKPIFQLGPLDQGYWPDGLFTAPTDEALKSDIEKTKALGFNLIRKHMKVEPARWYYHCDKLGMLVWQDMPSTFADSGLKWLSWKYTDDDRNSGTMTTKERMNFRREWDEIMTSLMNFPSIVVWTPFNEHWGQTDTKFVCDLTRLKDNSRLINSASGGNFIPNTGDIMDTHFYVIPDKIAIADINSANVIGECGGIGRSMKGHLWTESADAKNWGYTDAEGIEKYTAKYEECINVFRDISKSGICAGVYTQITDVESEINGLYTYDRKAFKGDFERIKKVNQDVIKSLSK